MRSLHWARSELNMMTHVLRGCYVNSIRRRQATCMQALALANSKRVTVTMRASGHTTWDCSWQHVHAAKMCKQRAECVRFLWQL